MLKNKKKLLITGSRGFIGKNLIKKLSKNYFIYATTSKNIKDKKYIKYINYTNKNLSIFQDLKIEYIINCHGKIANHNYEDIYNDHFIFVKKLLNNINKKYLEKIIHIGSMDEYSNFISGKDRLLKEKPNDTYGKIKNLVSKLIIDYSKKNKIKCIILRIFLAYGKDQKLPRLIPYLKSCIKNNKIAHLNDLNALKSFIHIEDFIEIIKYSLQNNMKYNIYNISSGKKYSIKSIVNYLRRKYNLQYTYEIKKKPKTQFLINSKINNELNIKYRNFYKELDLIIAS